MLSSMLGIQQQSEMERSELMDRLSILQAERDNALSARDEALSRLAALESQQALSSEEHRNLHAELVRMKSALDTQMEGG